MFQGSLPALVTPFSNGQVDTAALRALVEWQIENGTHGLVPAGTTGESPTLSHEEHDLVVKTVVDAAAGRVPVIAGAGSNNTTEAVRLTHAAKDAGADAALVVTPYYNKPTQQGLDAHFSAVAECGLPVIIYNIPGRSVIDMSPSTMGVLAQNAMIVGVKDATGDLSRVPLQRYHCGADFIQLSGEDMTALAFNAHGGHGCISVTANVAPRQCADFQDATLRGDYETARRLLDKLIPLHHAIFLEPGTAGAKYALSRLGLCTEDVRLPLTPLSTATKQAIDNAMDYAGIVAHN